MRQNRRDSFYRTRRPFVPQKAQPFSSEVHTSLPNHVYVTFVSTPKRRRIRRHAVSMPPTSPENYIPLPVQLPQIARRLVAFLLFPAVATLWFQSPPVLGKSRRRKQMLWIHEQPCLTVNPAASLGGRFSRMGPSSRQQRQSMVPTSQRSSSYAERRSWCSACGTELKKKIKNTCPSCLIQSGLRGIFVFGTKAEHLEFFRISHGLLDTSRRVWPPFSEASRLCRCFTCGLLRHTNAIFQCRTDRHLQFLLNRFSAPHEAFLAFAVDLKTEALNV
jgi:hypothetical protein